MYPCPRGSESIFSCAAFEAQGIKTLQNYHIYILGLFFQEHQPVSKLCWGLGGLLEPSPALKQSSAFYLFYLLRFHLKRGPVLKMFENH